MPADTETRIVEMRFSNKDFERNIAKSKKSLEDFKKELNFEETGKGLRNFASSMNAIDFYSLSSNIQQELHHGPDCHRTKQIRRTE